MLQALFCTDKIMLCYAIIFFGNEITSCKGGFLYDSLQALNFGAHANNYVGGYGKYQGLRLVRPLK